MLYIKHPPFNNKQKCERCHIIFIWNPEKESGKYMLSAETINKHHLKLKPKDYFLCAECAKDWNFDSVEGNFQEEYAKQFKKFIGQRTFIFR